MGNCLETCVHRRRLPRQQAEAIENGEQEGRLASPEKATSTTDSTGSNLVSGSEKNGTMRIKLVLTKEELEWLLIQLNQNKDDADDDEDEDQENNKQQRTLEDVLDEIERWRRIRSPIIIRRSSDSVIGWKPSLESITESPNDLF